MANQKKARSSCVLWLILVICLALIGVSCYHIAAYQISKKQLRKQNEQLITSAVHVHETSPASTDIPTTPAGEAALEQTEPEETEPIPTAPITVDFSTLLEISPDVVGWLYMPDSLLNYPVVQADDNDYYLHRLLNGYFNYAGTPFMDYRNQPDFSDPYTMLYGHAMKDGSMFGQLSLYKQLASEPDYYENHKIMYLLTPKQNYQVDLVAGFVTDGNASLYYLDQSDEARNNFLETALANSTFSSDVTVPEDGRLLVLSTCSYEWETARYVVVGLLTEIG